MLDFTKHYATRLTRLVTPQAERIPGTTQVPNSAGGYAWPVDKWTALRPVPDLRVGARNVLHPRAQAHGRERDERA